MRKISNYLVWLFIIVLMIMGTINIMQLELRFKEIGELPKGIYQYKTAKLKSGDWVELCLPSELSSYARLRGYLHAGSCDDGAEPYFLQVLAMPGDTVEVTHFGIIVNGNSVDNSLRLERDANGQEHDAIPIGKYLIKPNEMWVMGPRDESWDSRYFGAIPQKYIKRIFEPKLAIIPSGKASEQNKK